MASNNLVVKALRRAKRIVTSYCPPWRLRRQILDVLPRSGRGLDEWVVADVGANLGQTALQMRWALRGVARPIIHCFEPFAENYATLQANTSRHSCIHTHRMAMGEREASMSIALSPQSQWHSIANQDQWRARAGACEEIEVSTLDAFADREGIERIAILKTDTEGYDLEVLRGARSLLESHRIGAVICEVGFNPEDKQHTFFPGVFSYLLDRGYRLYLVDDQIVYRSPMWGGVPSVGYANAWFVAPKSGR